MSSQIESRIYGPELLAVLQEIFDQVWQELNSTGYATDRYADQRRNDLAQMIILAHRSGLQPDEIKAAVLRDMVGREYAAAEHSRYIPQQRKGNAKTGQDMSRQ